ncbi:sigma-70 family RNA polymerase sigma factor [Arthrobacter sp.]|uniref:sigma-70 family RNA polymerase sigma factor n=1 Tax=Arthrobacter sp. TaxID=1667 RepID=UPI0025910EF5|nr:sigma-70 family RNA polymerase sigma factor [Arthrobacter sp.]
MTQVTDSPTAGTAVEPHPAGTAAPPCIPAAEDYAFLYPWQQEALDAWHNNARRGVIEAVTGSGKTRLGVAAAHEAVRQGVKVLILVPTAELQSQWLATFRRDFPSAATGALGNGRTDSLDDVDVLVAIVHSAATRDTLREHKAGLLIADECHRYAAPLFSAALGHGYNWRLGLTATYERNDGGHVETLSPYFGGVVFTLWYDRALRDRVIAPFDIALVGVELTAAERARYDELSATMADAARYLKQYAGVARSPFPAFIAAVAALASSVSLTAESGLARKYMKAMSSRLSLLADTRTKGWALAALRNAVSSSGGTLIFTQTQASARSAQGIFRALGCTANAIYSGMSSGERRQGLAGFATRDAQVLAAPRILDEGVDVPEADLGIIVAANRSQRQLVQRLGRVIRRKVDGRAGRLVVLYAKGTVEDPAVQGEEFLGRVLPFARRHASFEIATDIAAIEDFLRYPNSHVALAGCALVGRTDAGETRGTGGPASSVPTEPLFGLPEYDDDGEPCEVLSPFDGLSDDIVADYLRRIGSFPLLSAVEEVDLAQEIEAGLLAAHKIAARIVTSRRELRELEAVSRAGRAAMETFLNCNLRLVVSIAKRHQGQGMDFIDLIAEGNQGLLRAVQKFDYTRGFKFSTYATWWIRQATARALADQARTIRLPVHFVDEVNKLQAVSAELAVRLDRDPTAVELAAELGTDVVGVRKILRLSQYVFSLDVEVPDGRGGTETLGEQLYDPADPSPCDVVSVRSRASAIHAVLDTLSEREAGVVAMRFGLTDGEPKTLEEIGLVYGVTRERIRQIESKTLAKLRHPSRSFVLRSFHDAPIENDDCLTDDEKAVRQAAAAGSLRTGVTPGR